jgi:hypothetical protein
MPTIQPYAAGKQLWQGFLTKPYVAGNGICHAGEIHPPLPTDFSNTYTVQIINLAVPSQVCTYWLLNTANPLALGTVLSGADQAFSVGATVIITVGMITPASTLTA